MSNTSNEYIDKVLHAAPFADNDAGIPQMCALIRSLRDERDALQGLSPEGVWGLIEAAMPFIEAMEDSVVYELLSDDRPILYGVDDGLEFEASRITYENLKNLRAALTKIKGDE